MVPSHFFRKNRTNDFLLKRHHYDQILAALDEGYSSSLRTIFVVIFWAIHVQTMVTRSILYHLYIGALPIRPNPSPTEVNNKHHVLSYIFIYRWLLVANTYLPIVLSSMVVDSLVTYPWNVVSLVAIHTFLQSILKRLAHLLHINPPFDDIQYCQFLIAAASVFTFYLVTMIFMLYSISAEASA
jgi:hypothetical protein